MPRSSTVSRQWSSMYRESSRGVGRRGWMSQSMAPRKVSLKAFFSARGRAGQAGDLPHSRPDDARAPWARRGRTPSEHCAALTPQAGSALAPGLEAAEHEAVEDEVQELD